MLNAQTMDIIIQVNGWKADLTRKVEMAMKGKPEI